MSKTLNFKEVKDSGPYFTKDDSHQTFVEYDLFIMCAVSLSLVLFRSRYLLVSEPTDLISVKYETHVLSYQASKLFCSPLTIPFLNTDNATKDQQQKT